MKKALYIVFLLSAILLTSCNNQDGKINNQDAEMYIAPSEFSEETKEVVSIFDDEISFFDLKLDNTASYYDISLWTCNDNIWSDTGGINGEIDFLSNRVAIYLDDEYFKAYIQDETGNSKYVFNLDKSINFKNTVAYATKKLSEQTNIELNNPVPLLIKTGDEDYDSYPAELDNNFQNIKCNVGVAVVLTLSDKPIQ